MDKQSSIWFLEAFCDMYSEDCELTLMAVFDSCEKAKADAERVTPGLVWQDESDSPDNHFLFRANVEKEYMGVFNIEAWLVTNSILNKGCNLKSWQNNHG